jgi:hypothetical protein
LLAQTHTICLITQAQRGFLLFLMVNQGKNIKGFSPTSRYKNPKEFSFVPISYDS